MIEYKVVTGSYPAEIERNMNLAAGEGFTLKEFIIGKTGGCYIAIMSRVLDA
jgi:hypothetical protein